MRRKVTNNIYERTAKTDAGGPFVMGDVVSWLDSFLSASLKHLKNILDEDSEEWKEVASLNEGSWTNLLQVVEDQAIN